MSIERQLVYIRDYYSQYLLHTLAYDHCIWIYLGLVDSCGLYLVDECYEHQVGCVREDSWGCLALLQASFYIPTRSDTVINA